MNYIKLVFFTFSCISFQLAHATDTAIFNIRELTPKSGIPCELDGYQLDSNYGVVKNTETNISILFKSTSLDRVDAYLVFDNEVKFKFSNFPQCLLDGFLDYVWVEEDNNQYSVTWRVLTTGSATGEPVCHSIFTKAGKLISSKGESDYNNHDYYCMFVSD